MSNAATAPQTTFTFEEKLDRLAKVAVQVGLGLQEGQEMVLTSTVDALPLVRRVTAHAYQTGANLVTTILTDEPSALLRYQHARNESFDAAADWLYEGMAQAYRGGAAPTACMSFNYHRDHFGVAWDLRDARGEAAHTGCVAFGMDRIVVALFCVHGLYPFRWPASTKLALGL